MTVFFDVETTGTDSTLDQIIEIYAAKYDDSFQLVEEYYSRFNPTCPISEGALSKHGLTAEILSNEPLFQEKCQEIYDFFHKCDLAGYNVRFDIDFLTNAFIKFLNKPINLTTIKIVDVYQIWLKNEPRDLMSASKYYLGEEFDGAHAAKNDIEATVKIYEAQIKKYGKENCDIPYEWVDSGKKFKIQDNKIVYDFGKHKGVSIQEVNKLDPSYLSWIANNKTFSDETRLFANLFQSKLKD